jgi:hypothetical protein
MDQRVQKTREIMREDTKIEHQDIGGKPIRRNPTVKNN